VSRRSLLLTGVCVGIVALLGVVLVATTGGIEGSGGSTATLAGVLRAARPAGTPFVGLTETNLGVGGRCLKVVVADTLSERVAGLRERSDLGGYDGMLFVFDGPTDVGFTMSTVPVPLEIGFYDGAGDPVSERHMVPCPDVEARCPAYRASGPFSYAVETPGGSLPSGALGGCS
jgi:uncharacterized membrane protein (UPF0127 family)